MVSIWSAQLQAYEGISEVVIWKRGTGTQTQGTPRERKGCLFMLSAFPEQKEGGQEAQQSNTKS